MAAASYTTDLSDWIADNDITAWSELTAATAGGAPDEADTESALQGTNACSQITNATTPCSMIRILGSPFTFPADNVALVWHGHGVATALDSYANGGLRIAMAGSNTGNWKAWSVGGNDVPPFPYAKWVNTPIDPTVAADYTNGTPPTNGTDIRGIGSICLLTQVVARGQPHIVDIIRTGRAESRLTGGDLGNGYATFGGFAAVNDTTTNRWGLIQAVSGGYQWKGLMSLGTDATAVDFRDSNQNIFIQDCRKVSSTFNLIEVRNASSRVDWTNITITNVSPSTNVAKGNFAQIHTNDLNIEGCSFVDMGTFGFLSTAYVNDTTFRRCSSITHSGGTFSNNLIARSTGSVLTTLANAATIENCNFVSQGTGHAIVISGTAGDFTFVGNTFSGYAASNGSTGNEAIWVNIATGTVNITISGGGSTPTIRTSGATVNVISGATVTFTGLPTGCDIVILTAGTSTILVQVDAHGSTSYGWSYEGTPTVDVGFLKPGYVPYYIRNLPLSTLDSSIPVTLTADRNYT